MYPCLCRTSITLETLQKRRCQSDEDAAQCATCYYPYVLDEIAPVSDFRTQARIDGLATRYAFSTLGVWCVLLGVSYGLTMGFVLYAEGSLSRFASSGDSLLNESISYLSMFSIIPGVLVFIVYDFKTTDNTCNSILFVFFVLVSSIAWVWAPPLAACLLFSEKVRVIHVERTVPRNRLTQTPVVQHEELPDSESKRQKEE